MTKWIPGSNVAVAGFMAALFLVSLPTPGQDGDAPVKGKGKQKGAKAKSAPTPRLADGKVDLSGLWSPDRNFIYDISDSLKPGDKLPTQPWAEKLTRERMSKDDPEANCLPTGVPRQAPYPWQIVPTPTRVFFLFEGNIHSYRQIFLDRASHPADPNPTWYGDSIAKWDGDTLVVESSGFNGKSWLDQVGHPSSESLRVTERFHRRDLGHMDIQATITDPIAYTKPWSFTQPLSLMVDTDLLELVCNENNKDLPHLPGR